MAGISFKKNADGEICGVQKKEVNTYHKHLCENTYPCRHCSTAENGEQWCMFSSEDVKISRMISDRTKCPRKFWWLLNEELGCGATMTTVIKGAVGRQTIKDEKNFLDGL